MKSRRWMPTTAGYLDILYGIGGILLGLLAVALNSIDPLTGTLDLILMPLLFIMGLFDLTPILVPPAS